MMLLFYLAAAVAVIATIGVIVQTNIVHALIYLILSLLAVAVIFYVLGAPLAAMLEAIVYAGAIMVLFLFVIMMLNLGQSTRQQERAWLAGRGWIVPALLAAVLLGQLLYVLSGVEGMSAGEQVGVMAVGTRLFGPYVLAVELASILLLAGLITAYHLARKPKAGDE
ncbi:MAG: NADH-quinone oxidoreductase subunit J [Gammaproteobacteria bacterium]|nr:NADH-quinone oxidoreductase subunit J [Gammaproteobacteria bacterium]MDE0478020.1 NADH-quinone oxidoreductase subunit J [Gammaproteobacteria bacterium]